MEEVAGFLVAATIVTMLVSMSRSALRNLAAGRANERRRTVEDIRLQSRDAESCRRRIDALTGRLVRRPGDADAFLQRGLYHQVLGELEAAAEDFSQALQVLPDDPYLLLCRGAIEIHRGHTANGIADLDRALAIRPKYYDVLLLRGLSHWRLGQKDEAARDLDTALTQPLREFDAFLQRAELRAHLKHDFAGAEADLSEALRLRPGNVEALFLRGWCRDAMGRPAEGAEDSHQAAGQEAKTFQELWCRAYARGRLEQYEAALQDASAVLELWPTNAEMLRLRGRVRLQLGQMEEAFSDFQRLARVGSLTAEDTAMKALILADTGQYLEAIADYERAIEMDPQCGYANNNLAWLLATCPDAAIRDGARALGLAQTAREQLPPDSDFPKGTTAAAYAECGDFARAIEWEEQASALRHGIDHDDWAFLIDLYRSGQPHRTAAHDWRNRARAKGKSLAAPVG